MKLRRCEVGKKFHYQANLPTYYLCGDINLRYMHFRVYYIPVHFNLFVFITQNYINYNILYLRRCVYILILQEKAHKSEPILIRRQVKGGLFV